MNTASRMESTGEGNRIHLSQETADQLVLANKGHWIKAREDQVSVKGKGELTTFWLNTKVEQGGSNGASSERQSIDHGSISCIEDHAVTEANGREVAAVNSKIERLCNWNVDVMLRILKQIVARRESHPSTLRGKPGRRSSVESCPRAGTVIDEVKEIIHLPEFDAEAVRNQRDPETIELDEKVISQLHQYVEIIASMVSSH